MLYLLLFLPFVEVRANESTVLIGGDMQADKVYKSDLAIRLFMASPFLSPLLQPVNLSHAEVEQAQQLLDSYQLGQPEFEVGLKFNVSIEKIQKLIDKWLIRKYVNQRQRNKLQDQMQTAATFVHAENNFNGEYYSVHGVSLIQTRTRIDEPPSSFIAYALCRIRQSPGAHQGLSVEQSQELYQYMHYITKREWLDYHGPMTRLVVDGAEEYAKYLPSNLDSDVASGP